jgi:hypothetical protein
LLAHRAENPVNRRSADRLETPSHLRVQRQMPVALHRGDQQRDERLQPLAADPVRGFPQKGQRLANRILVQSALWPRP